MRLSFGTDDLYAMSDKTGMHEYADVLESHEAKRYRASAIGRIRSNGMWEVRIEFVNLAEGERLRTDIETTQSNEEAFRYWAGGRRPRAGLSRGCLQSCDGARGRRLGAARPTIA